MINQQEMERVVKGLADESKGENGVVEFKYQGIEMYLISDVHHDRMRIITAVAQYSDLNKEIIDKTMESNFHTALDARYALSEDVLYAAYIHPLSKLDDEQIKSAVEQVYNLTMTFGDDYSSGSLIYNG